jgi:hypothetical protein
MVPVYVFDFQDRVERLGRSVVQGRANPSHRLAYAQAPARGGEGLSGVFIRFN